MPVQGKGSTGKNTSSRPEGQMQPPTSAAGDDKYCGAAAGGGARGWLLGGGAPRCLCGLPPSQLPHGAEKPALSPPPEKLWADMEQREPRLAITQLISAM